MTDPKTFPELIEAWGGVIALRDDLGVPYVTAQKMHQRGAIAPRHWPILLKKARGRNIRISAEALLRMQQMGRVSA